MLPIVISFAFAISVGLCVMLLGNLRSARAAQTAEVGARLSEFRGTSERRREMPPDPTASFAERVLRPLARRTTRSVTGLMPSAIDERIQGSLDSAGLRMTSSQFTLILVIVGGIVPIMLAGMMLSTGSGARTVLILWLAFTGLGIYGPRMWLSSKVKKRQKEIWKQLPDSFDLVTASVEAGLGIDAALAKVMEKAKGAFSEELRRTMQEVSMGRSRRDALRDLGTRTGVEELQTFLNAIVQAETMGVSIGNVIRVQTGVLRTKRRQKAEEQAFKAPIKMVFPLVFFIFPSIFIVIGGPAIITLKDGF